MKTIIILIAAAFALPVLVTSCKEKGPAEKAGEKIDDALDQRPGEKVKDAAEDVKDAAKDAAEDVKDAAKDAADAVKDTVK